MTRKLMFSFTIKVWDCDKWQISYHNTILNAFNCKIRGKWCLLCLGCWGNEAHEIIHVKYLAQWLKNWHIIWTQLMPAIIIPPKNVLLISRLKYATANYSVRSLKDLKIYRYYRELIIFPPPWYLTRKTAIRFTQFTSHQTVSSNSSFINPFVQSSIFFSILPPKYVICSSPSLLTAITLIYLFYCISPNFKLLTIIKDKTIA